MTKNERLRRYAAIEAARDRPLIVYATSTRVGVESQMAADAVREMIDQIDAINDDIKSVDILIHSAGGDALTAWKLMSVLRERFDSVGVLIPFAGFSAATLFCLGADELVMHPHASLGPIDPQIGIRLEDGKTRAFSFEDVGAFLRFLKEEIGLSEQQYVSVIAEKLFSVVDAVHVGGAKRASELSTDVGERLLKMHMTGADEQGRPREIAEGLNKSFFAHGDAVSRTRARDLQLKIADDDPELERLIWEAFLGLESYMELRRPFDALQHYIANGGEESIAPAGPLTLPANAPDQIAQQVWSQAANQALQNAAHPALEVDYELVNAVLESTRLASEFRTCGTVSAARLRGGDIRVAANVKRQGWNVTQPADSALGSSPVEADN